MTWKSLSNTSVNYSKPSIQLEIRNKIHSWVLKTFKTNSSTSFVDSLLIVSCDDPKVLGLISRPTQALFDETTYRIYKKNNTTATYKDSIGIINRHSYFNVACNTKESVINFSAQNKLSYCLI